MSSDCSEVFGDTGALDRVRALGHVESLCRQVLQQEGLRGWTIRWDNAKRRAGACNHKARLISFSRVLIPLYPQEVQKDIVMHEVAHAIAGPGAGHGSAWKKVAKRLGATPRAMLSRSLPQPPAKWEGTCPRCGAKRHLHSSPRRVVSCGSCSRTFSAALILQWKNQGQRVIPGGSYARELTRLRV